MLIAPGNHQSLHKTRGGSHLPSARVRIYADAGHGFLYQFPTEFADAVASFLVER